MGRITLTAIAIGALAATAAPVHAAAKPGVAPIGAVGANGARLMATVFSRDLTTPVSESPNAGNGDPCMYSTDGGRKILTPAFPPSGPLKCTVARGTPVLMFDGVSCSSVEKAPFFAATARAQRACTKRLVKRLRTFTIRIDGGAAFDARRERFAVLTPQMTLDLPKGNLLGVPAQRGTFMLRGWGALIRNLDAGRHVLALHFADPSGSQTVKAIITVRG